MVNRTNIIGLLSLAVVTSLLCGCNSLSKSRTNRITLSPEDDLLLEEITHASFMYFWKEVHPESGLVRDKTGSDVCSVAAVGFQLATLPIGVERNYVSYQQAHQRALNVLRVLENSNAHHEGMFCHFIHFANGNTAHGVYQRLASTIDTALLVSGMIAAGEYFGGEVKSIADRLFARVNWREYYDEDRGWVYMGWEPRRWYDMQGPGRFTSPAWNWYTDEILLISLLGRAAPLPEHRLPPEVMTHWKRQYGNYKDGQPFIYTWPGTLFTYTFAHCFYDFRRMGPDSQGVDWFENTRRAVIANRDWCRDHADEYASYGTHRWGITAGSGPGDRYIIPGHQPRGKKRSQPEGGTLHPYGAAMALPFLPDEAMKALRTMRHVNVEGEPLWTSPDQGGYGFWDGFNIDQNWVSSHVIGVAQGPMLLLIENARTGLIWNLVMKHHNIREGIARAGFTKKNNMTIQNIPWQSLGECR